jgi:hypothetical protein
VAVNMTHDPRLPGHGKEFIPLARRVDPELPAQQIWLTDFTPEFVDIEPRPLCAFLSGSFHDWCQVNREHWRGTSRVLARGTLPIWASCGGAQGLAILATVGVDHPWDCPHCRKADAPLLPVYGHIGHHAFKPCGDYAGCVFERGPHWIQPLGSDPAFAGLEHPFLAMESHCGQIEFPPDGWHLVATAGPGTLTRNQCLRWGSRPIYAAQFHIEMAGTASNSETIMRNFLKLAAEETSPRRDGAAPMPRSRIQR